MGLLFPAHLKNIRRAFLAVFPEKIRAFMDEPEMRDVEEMRIGAVFAISRNTCSNVQNYVEPYDGKKARTHFLMLKNRILVVNYSLTV